MDIHQSLANPFTSYKVNARYYTAFVYGVAIFVATVFVSVVPIQYGLSVDPMIWVNVYNNSSEGRYTKFAVFYVFMIAIYVYCGITAIWARNQIYKGLEDTLAVRKYSVSKQTRCKCRNLLAGLSYLTINLLFICLFANTDVIGYFLFWTCVFVLQFLNYLNGDGAKDNDGYFSDVSIPLNYIQLFDLQR